MRRREFLAAGLACGQLRAAGRIDRSRVSAITDEIARSPQDAIAFARQYRLRWVELRGVPGGRASYFELGENELRQAARELADNGLKVSFLNTSMLKYMLPGTEPANPRANTPRAEAMFARRMESLKQALDAAHVFGTDKVRVFTFARVQEPAGLLSRLADIVGEMTEVAARAKVRLLVENEGSCNVATCVEVAALLKAVPSPWFGVNWDPMNGLRFQEAPYPDGYALLPKDRLGNVQIKGRSLLEGPQQLNWAAIFRALEADGYAGQVGLETHYGENRIQSSHDSMQTILRIVEPS